MLRLAPLTLLVLLLPVALHAQLYIDFINYFAENNLAPYGFAAKSHVRSEVVRKIDATGTLLITKDCTFDTAGYLISESFHHGCGSYDTGWIKVRQDGRDHFRTLARLARKDLLNPPQSGPEDSLMTAAVKMDTSKGYFVDIESVYRIDSGLVYITDYLRGQPIDSGIQVSPLPFLFGKKAEIDTTYKGDTTIYSWTAQKGDSTCEIDYRYYVKGHKPLVGFKRTYLTRDTMTSWEGDFYTYDSKDRELTHSSYHPGRFPSEDFKKTQYKDATGEKIVYESEWSLSEPPWYVNVFYYNRLGKLVEDYKVDVGNGHTKYIGYFEYDKKGNLVVFRDFADKTLRSETVITYEYYR